MLSIVEKQFADISYIFRMYHTYKTNILADRDHDYDLLRH